MKDLVFLPDRDGRDEIGDASGFVRLGASGDALQLLTERLAVPAKHAVSRVDVLAWRSALTLALLADKLSLPGPFWDMFRRLGQHLNLLGFLIIGVFAAAWLGSWLIYRARGLDEVEVVRPS